MSYRADKTSRDAPVRWGMIGCGSVTEVKSGPAYQRTEGFTLAGVTNRSLAKAHDYAQRHGVAQVYDDAQALIDDPNIDAVYIATPPDSHLHYALEVAKAGKPCCLEKPMAPSYEESAAILEAFTERAIPLFVAYYRRSLPRFDQVKSWLEGGEIGEVRHTAWHLSKPANDFDLSTTPNWRTEAQIAYGGYFDDLASHGLDLISYFLGEVEEASGFAVNQQGLYTAKDAVVASWLHRSGVTGTGSWNFGSSKREDKLTIYGNEGHIRFSVFEDAPLVLNQGKAEQELFITNPKTVQSYHVANIQQHLAGLSQHPSIGATATHTAWLMDKILGRI